MRLENKVAIVTGAGSGIGHATAVLFAREGASVLVADVMGERAKSVAAEIQKLGGVAEAFTGDVSSEKDAEQMVGRADELWHRLDILVNNAASFHHKTVEEATRDDWEKVLRVNVMGTSFCSRYAVAAMKQRKGGAIVNVGSQAREVANVILFAASDDASYMTGATLVVDGGYSS